MSNYDQLTDKDKDNILSSIRQAYDVLDTGSLPITREQLGMAHDKLFKAWGFDLQTMHVHA